MLSLLLHDRLNGRADIEHERHFISPSDSDQLYLGRLTLREEGAGTHVRTSNIDGPIDAYLVASSWPPRPTVRWCPAMDGEKVQTLKGENVRCYYVQTPDERIAFSDLNGCSTPRSLSRECRCATTHKIMDRMWYERKIGPKRLNLTVGNMHIEVN